jgi:hypothetical protein
MKVHSSIAGALCVDVLAAIPLTVLLGLGMVVYHQLHRLPDVVDASWQKYAQFFESIIEPVPGAAVDRCEGQSTAPAIAKRLRRSPTLAELESLFGPSTVDHANTSGPNRTPDPSVEVHSWDGGLKAEFDVIRGAITDLVTIEFNNERVGRSPNAWRKYCDPDPTLDFDVIAQKMSHPLLEFSAGPVDYNGIARSS